MIHIYIITRSCGTGFRSIFQSSVKIMFKQELGMEFKVDAC